MPTLQSGHHGLFGLGRKAMNSGLRKALIVALTALNGLIGVSAGYMRAATEGKKAEAKAWDAYGEYVTSQLYRDEALARSLERCRTLEAMARAPVSRMMREPPEEEPQADVMLDRIARRNGWRPQP